MFALDSPNPPLSGAWVALLLTLLLSHASWPWANDANSSWEGRCEEILHSDRGDHSLTVVALIPCAFTEPRP